jgi:Protein of unknown function (DUF2637)
MSGGAVISGRRGAAATADSVGRVGGDRWIRWTTTACVLGLAGIAAMVSFRHIHALALAHGESKVTAALIPLSVDGMIVASSMTLLADSRLGRGGGVLPWVLLALGSAASLAANVAVAEPTVYGRVIAAWPSLALIGAYELLMRQIRNSTTGPKPQDEASPSAALAAGSPAVDRSAGDGEPVVPRSAATPSSLSGRAPRDATSRHQQSTGPAGASGGAAGGALLAAAQRIDATHRAERGRPASAETLRVGLRVGAATARKLKDAIRATAA